MFGCADDQGKSVEELLPLGRWQHGEQAGVRGCGAGLRVTQAPPALGGELDGVGPAVLLGALPMNEATRQKPRDNVGKSGPVDPGPIHEIGLGQPFFFGDGHEYGELPRGETA